MKNIRRELNSSGFWMAAIAAVAVLGCGKVEPKSTVNQPQPVVNVPGGPVFTNRVCFQSLAPCVDAAQFEPTCRSIGGIVGTKYGPTTCTVIREYFGRDSRQPSYISFYFPSRLPILTPTVVDGGYDTGIRLLKGAKLEYSTTKPGKWGYFQESGTDFWGGRIKFSWFKAKCDSIGWDGMSKTGELTHQDQPAGLFGSDGTESFYLGASSKTVTINNEGTLRIGINADPNTPYGCTTVGYPRFVLTTCEDANGASYTCH